MKEREQMHISQASLEGQSQINIEGVIRQQTMESVNSQIANALQSTPLKESQSPF